MPKLRRLSGHAVVKILETFGFMKISQRGSHVKLKRESEHGSQILTIPLHHELDSGTLRTIVRQASRYISEHELHPHFYHS